MMMKRLTFRLQKQNKALTTSVEIQKAVNASMRKRLQTLLERLRGDGAKAPVPEDLVASYQWAIDYVTKHNYTDGNTLSVFRDTSVHGKGMSELRGQEVIDWKVMKIDEGLFDLEMVNRWTY